MVIYAYAQCGWALPQETNTLFRSVILKTCNKSPLFLLSSIVVILIGNHPCGPPLDFSKITILHTSIASTITVKLHNQGCTIAATNTWINFHENCFVHHRAISYFYEFFLRAAVFAEDCQFSVSWTAVSECQCTTESWILDRCSANPQFHKWSFFFTG